MSILVPDAGTLKAFRQWAVDCGFAQEDDMVTRIILDVAIDNIVQVQIWKHGTTQMNGKRPPMFKNCEVHTTETVRR